MTTDGLKALWKTVFGDPDSFIDAFFEDAFSPNRCRWIREDGHIVSALYWLDCEYSCGKLAYIYAVATDPAYRGKGLASRLLEETHAHLKALGYAGAVLKPANGLFPFYGRLGYVSSGHIRYFDAQASDTPIPVKRLSLEEFAALRRKYLPENSVIQEGATLLFLSRFATYYEAPNALVTVDTDSDSVLEYLGDPLAAPGILAALSIPQAQIRTLGDDVPFTMFHPLNCTKIPGYLGITLE